jgi:hypothetical protein
MYHCRIQNRATPEAKSNKQMFKTEQPENGSAIFRL